MLRERRSAVVSRQGENAGRVLYSLWRARGTGQQRLLLLWEELCRGGVEEEERDQAEISSNPTVRIWAPSPFLSRLCWACYQEESLKSLAMVLSIPSHR